MNENERTTWYPVDHAGKAHVETLEVGDTVTLADNKQWIEYRVTEKDDRGVRVVRVEAS